MSADVSRVRRNILALFAVVSAVGVAILFTTKPIVLQLSPQAAWSSWTSYLLLPLLIFGGGQALLSRYLLPIARLARAQQSGSAIPDALLQRARTLAFEAPIVLMLVPVILTFLVATAADLVGAFFVEDYLFAERYLVSILITTVAVGLSLVLSVVSRRMLLPVLFFTATLAEDVGPRFTIRTRQFVTTSLLIFSAVFFLATLGYNLMVRGVRYELQEKYALLADSISGDLGDYLDDQTLVDYVSSLHLREGQAFILDASRGTIVSTLDEEHQALQAVGGTLAARVLNLTDGAAGRLGPMPMLGDELLLIQLDRRGTNWWLGVRYAVRPLDIPVVRQSLSVLVGFVLCLVALMAIVNHYLSQSLGNTVSYVTTRLHQLAQGEEGQRFERLSVLSLDEVGDLVAAFNRLLDRVERQQTILLRDEAELRALLDVSRDIGLILDTELLLSQVIESVGRIFGYRNMAVFLLDRSAGEVYAAAYPEYLLPSIVGRRWPLDPESVVGRVMGTGNPLLVQEGQALDSYFPMQGGVRSELAVPMVVAGETVGVFDIVSDEPDAFNLEDLRVATAVADQVSVALHNAELYRQVEEQRQMAALMAELAKIVNSTLDLDQVLNGGLERLAQVIPYDSATIMLEQGPNLVVAAARGFEDLDAVVGSVFRAQDERNIGYQVMQAQQVRVEADVQALTEWGRDDDAIDDLRQIHAWIGAPLVVKGHSLGLLTVDHHQRGFYSAEDGALAAAFADHIAVAVQNARLYQTAQDRARELALLHEVSHRISLFLDVDKLLTEIVERVTETFHYQVASIHLVDEATGELRFAAQCGLDEHLTRRHVVRVGDKGIVPWVYEHRQPLLVPDVTQDSRYVAVTDDIRSELAIPLMVGESVIGVFNLESEAVSAFSEDDVRLMTALAHQVATALHNARLFQRVRNQARELKVVTRTLADEKSRLNAILQSIVDGLVVTDPAGDITLVNPVFVHMFGKPATALLGQPLVRAVDVPELLELVRSALGNTEVTFTSEIPMPDGRTLKAASASIEDESRGLGVVTVVRDITREKEVDSMKTEFISTVSHELRTPLTSVLGFAKLISRVFEREIVPKLTSRGARVQRAQQRVRENLEIIVLEAERLTRLINDVLDIAKMESGDVAWHDRSFDLSALAAEVAESMRPSVEGKGLTLTLELTKFPLYIEADPKRIRQVLFNLISNAIKFTETGGITLTLYSLVDGERAQTWQAPPGSEGGVMCSVADTGVGIPSESMPRLFKRFQQIVADTLTGKPEGTGLGLAICKEIVNHYGGVIWAQSSPGQGSTFFFALPTRPVAPAAKPAVVPEVRRRAPVTGGEDRPLLLVVDDEVNIRSLWGQELEAEGYRVVEAANGSDAIQLARHTKPRPDLILLDVMLPDISGFDVLRILKSDPTTRSIPILIVSIVEDRQQGLDLGAAEYLVKPVEAPQLLDAIANLLAKG